jgi:hypothetical protein
MTHVDVAAVRVWCDLKTAGLASWGLGESLPQVEATPLA